jgi:hypothetical protein
MSATGSTEFVAVEVQALQKLFADKEAEIERLRQLLTECADALSHYALLNDFEKNLLQRAREATA